MENDKIAAGDMAHAHVVDILQSTAFRSLLRKRFVDLPYQFRIGVATIDFPRFHGLDMRLDFNVWTHLVFDRRLQARGEFMRLAQTHPPVDLHIEADTFAALHFMNRDVVNGKAQARGGQLDALKQAFIVKRPRKGDE